MTTTSPMGWQQAHSTAPRDFTCGYCGREVASNVGMVGSGHKAGAATPTTEFIYVCPRCTNATVFTPDGKQHPAPRTGKEIAKLTEPVKTVYTEIRDCTASGSYLACVLTCRVLLMHIAKDKGGVTAATFKQAIEAIEAAGYITKPMAPWVHAIRDKANDANHDLVMPTAGDAAELVKLVEMLLTVIYELTP